MEITPELLSDLKAKAQAATPGPWDSYGDGTVFYIDDYDIPRDICVPENQNNTSYIAAASPDVVLALIAGYQDKKEALHGVFLLINKLRDILSLPEDAKLHEVIDLAISRIEGLKEDLDAAARSAADESMKAGQLEEEANWLAENLEFLQECPAVMDRHHCPDGGVCVECWRQASRKAVEVAHADDD